ncbi:MAG: hypothetical protein M1834_003948 [Cirrosporium novae-zelandiae]|nr:MAG: hypothetical protein M1834_003948 [Cirrosporium novae-zelandiae]
MSEQLSRALCYLLEENRPSIPQPRPRGSCHHHHVLSLDWILQTDTWNQLQVLRSLLCQRPPLPELPADISKDIDYIFQKILAHRVLTPTSSIPPQYYIPRGPSLDLPTPIRTSIWKGDITTLSEATAIVNAANSQLLGCIRPEHRCIDNIIHSAAGPDLRKACYELMSSQGHPEPVGSAKVTPGFNLPAKYVLHTVGPQLDPGQEPTSHERQDLANCYISCLETAESLPALEDGRKVVAFCCISTGLFSFPGQLASEIAVKTMHAWCGEHSNTSITDIIFNIFTDEDLDFYSKTLQQSNLEKCTVASPHQAILPPLPTTPNITTARKWLSQADYLLITAGAGLSAAGGLDYTSRSLFHRIYPGFIKYGLHRLYDVFGYNSWPSPLEKWSYYFTHLEMIRSWPPGQLYESLLAKLTTTSTPPTPLQFPSDHYFIRTTNADNLFQKAGFPPTNISTPQGQYHYLQCLANCNPSAVFPSTPFLAAALPFLSSSTQLLTNPACIPSCKFCGGELTICVRGGDYFNERPFQEQEEKYREFLERVKGDEGGGSGGFCVILELGVGLNTPGVLRWPDEELVEDGAGRFRLVRVGAGAAACVPWELEEGGMAVGIEGDIKDVLPVLIS